MCAVAVFHPSISILFPPFFLKEEGGGGWIVFLLLFVVKLLFNPPGCFFFFFFFFFFFSGLFLTISYTATGHTAAVAAASCWLDMTSPVESESNRQHPDQTRAIKRSAAIVVHLVVESSINRRRRKKETWATLGAIYIPAHITWPFFTGSILLSRFINPVGWNGRSGR